MESDSSDGNPARFLSESRISLAFQDAAGSYGSTHHVLHMYMYYVLCRIAWISVQKTVRRTAGR
jgi:hypothetical protein